MNVLIYLLTLCTFESITKVRHKTVRTMSSESGGAPASSSGSSSSSSNAPKKSLSELTQPELLSKCQTLLSIAQKSKAAKDDAVSKVSVEETNAIRTQGLLIHDSALTFSWTCSTFLRQKGLQEQTHS